jgi:cell division protein ZapA
LTSRAPASSERTVTLDVALLGRDYKVACRESERSELKDAVAFLDQRMREIRDGGKVAGADRIAVMAALNIAHELLRERAQAGAANLAPPQAGASIDESEVRRRIASMKSAVDDALTGLEKSS